MPSGKLAAHDVKAVEASIALPVSFFRLCQDIKEHHDGDTSQWQQMQKTIENKQHQYLHSKMDWQILKMYDNTSPFNVPRDFASPSDKWCESGDGSHAVVAGI